MKDFDTDRDERAKLDRRFRIGGETFRYRASVAPEAILRWTQFATDGDQENMLLAAARQRLYAAEQMDPPMGPNELARLQTAVADRAEAAALKGKREEEWLGLIDDTAISLIDPDQHELWAKVRAPDSPHPLSLGDLETLIEWLIGQVVGRPTESPSESTPTPSVETAPSEESSTSSTDASSSPEVPASTASTPEPDPEPELVAAASTPAS